MHAQIITEELSEVSVLQAGGGKEALELLQKVRPDIILLDLMMPELDGFEVLSAIGEQETNRTIPVVVLTGQALTESDMERLRGRVTAVLNKGLFSMDEIVVQLQQSLHQETKLPEETRSIVRTAVAYIHQHYDEPLNRTVLANYVGVSPSYFSRCFHQEMGIPYREYLNRYRINRARILLSQGAGNVTDVAYQVGFRNISYFSQVFRQVIGVSPQSYRKSMQ
jgi:YesN/AraC family two-component response regulator